MQIKRIWLVSFSPTGTSKRIIDAIASGMGDIPCEAVDLTYPDAVSDTSFNDDELVIIGVPVYSGRVAPLAVKRLAAVHGQNTPAVIVVTYGNREFEDALIELKHITEHAGFRPLAGCSFIGEHSFSGLDMPVAQARPDSADLLKARAFGLKIIEKLTVVPDSEPGSGLNVPGNIPYKESMGPLPFTPAVIQSECTRCAACISSCPAGAISMDPGIVMDRSLCIFCCACIKICPEGAIKIDAAPVLKIRKWLYENCRERKEPELYL